VGPGRPELVLYQLAPRPPYNEHFIRDIGVFQLGIDVALAAALRCAARLRRWRELRSRPSFNVVSHVVD
jgi:hypothetical protein